MRQPESRVWTGRDPHMEQKLAASRQAAGEYRLRAVRCPGCGFPLLEVVGDSHYLIRAKCRKCKFNEVIDTALFRTQYRRSRVRRR